ncbi:MULTISPECIES: hypothetical protein [unclassified Serratia (in: enterobacteria)]|uniref:hypothetical protein n=1 Tax=unclassified Serratia (in: enterobacteria) TaxID=2647522 RepID=UPI000508917B|nr:MULTISPECIES: hypothetical protein [unclassified Serratia (in: enterobacteria)]KFK95059.1 hypothetical protein IV04_21685 [Serratia sp. Ag1]KFK96018.1 hypothetical protein JV45_06375 [Serratia sp. Ag2]
MAKVYNSKTPKSPSSAFQQLHTKAGALAERSLYRRAAEVWRGGHTSAGLTEQERDLCVHNADLCAGQAKYTGKPES